MSATSASASSDETVTLVSAEGEKFIVPKKVRRLLIKKKAYPELVLRTRLFFISRIPPSPLTVMLFF